MAADDTASTACVARCASWAVQVFTTEVALTQVDIETHAPGAQGESQGADDPVMSQPPAGISAEASPMARVAEPCGPCMPPCAIATALACVPCTWHSVPLASRESWSRNAPESAATSRRIADMQ